MMVPLRVLGDRVLVTPDVHANAPEQTAGGIFVARSLAAAVTGTDATTSVSRGTVVAVGRPRHPLHHEAETLAARLERGVGLDAEVAHDAAQLLRDVTRRRPCVAVGDDVLFSHEVGQEIVVDGVSYLILHEEHLFAVVAPIRSYEVTFTHVDGGTTITQEEALA